MNVLQPDDLLAVGPAPRASPRAPRGASGSLPGVGGVGRMVGRVVGRMVGVGSRPGSGSVQLQAPAPAFPGSGGTAPPSGVTLPRDAAAAIPASAVTVPALNSPISAPRRVTGRWNGSFSPANCPPPDARPTTGNAR